jgi:hypothetical protein
MGTEGDDFAGWFENERDGMARALTLIAGDPEIGLTLRRPRRSARRARWLNAVLVPVDRRIRDCTPQERQSG